MPEEKKSQKRNEPKEQRRPRQGRRNAPPSSEKKPDKNDDKKEISKETKKSEYEPPGPEFYKNLKRETDEIVKITEEENNKYKKKEIQSNWSKYELPVQSYEEIEEQENMGADYEKLIQAPLAVGGYFQFKHEKSWDVDSAPSPYDKYFDFDMDTLSLAIQTIPFYERTSVDKSLFTETDIVTMDNRATKYKQKYFNDDSYSTPELESQEQILKNLMSDDDLSPQTEVIGAQESVIENSNNFVETEDKYRPEKNSRLEFENFNLTNDLDVDQGPALYIDLESPPKADEVLDIPKSIGNNHKASDKILKANKVTEDVINEEKFIVDDFIFTKANTSQSIIETTTMDSVKLLETKKDKNNPVNTQAAKQPVIESPEDLEKWLDDFLDG